PDTPLFLKFPDTAYHKHSPIPSRSGGRSNVFHGNRPMAVAPATPQGASAVPSLSVSGQGNIPGWFGFFAAYPSSASLARARDAAVSRSCAIECLAGVTKL